MFRETSKEIGQSQIKETKEIKDFEELRDLFLTAGLLGSTKSQEVLSTFTAKCPFHFLKIIL